MLLHCEPVIQHLGTRDSKNSQPARFESEQSASCDEQIYKKPDTEYQHRFDMQVQWGISYK